MKILRGKKKKKKKEEEVKGQKSTSPISRATITCELFLPYGTKMLF